MQPSASVLHLPTLDERALCPASAWQRPRRNYSYVMSQEVQPHVLAKRPPACMFSRCRESEGLHQQVHSRSHLLAQACLNWNPYQVSLQAPLKSLYPLFQAGQQLTGSTCIR